MGPQQMGPRQMGPQQMGPQQMGPQQVGPQEVGPQQSPVLVSKPTGTNVPGTSANPESDVVAKDPKATDTGIISFIYCGSCNFVN